MIAGTDVCSAYKILFRERGPVLSVVAYVDMVRICVETAESDNPIIDLSLS